MVTRFEYYTEGCTQPVYAYGVYWKAQTFTPTTSHYITKVRLKLRRGGDPRTLYVGIRATDGTGRPTGSDLASGSIDSSSITTDADGGWYYIDITAYFLSADTKYAIVVRMPDTDISDSVGWFYDSTGTYPRGAHYFSNNSGAGWAPKEDEDLGFEDWGTLGVEVIVTTDPATGIVPHKATLNGTLDDDGGEACDCGFEWGETEAYGNTTPTQSRTTGQHFPFTLYDLVLGQTYHFRAFATNSEGTTYGTDRTFTTAYRQLTVTSTTAESGFLRAAGHPDQGYPPVHDSPIGGGYESLVFFQLENWLFETFPSADNRYYISRGTLRFDTSPLPDDCTLIGAVLRLKVSRIVNAVGGGLYVQLVSGTDLHPTTMVVEDYGALLDKTAPIGQVVQIGDLVPEGWVEFNLASYLDNISKTGAAHTRVGVRCGADIESVVPNANHVRLVEFYSSGPLAAEEDKPRVIIDYAILPVVTTDPATGISAVSATLNGTLDDDTGEACNCGFEWGLNTGYGVTTSIQSKTTGQTFSQVLHGLVPGTTYHFRAFATNSEGTSYGADESFSTKPAISKAYALAREEL